MLIIDSKINDSTAHFFISQNARGKAIMKSISACMLHSGILILACTKLNGYIKVKNPNQSWVETGRDISCQTELVVGEEIDSK